MQEYVDIYNKMAQNEEIISDVKYLTFLLKFIQKFQLVFGDGDISVDYENSTTYSSMASIIKKEIEDYKISLNSEHKLFMEITEKFYEEKGCHFRLGNYYFNQRNSF